MYTLLHTFFNGNQKRKTVQNLQEKKVKMLQDLESGMQNLKYRRT